MASRKYDIRRYYASVRKYFYYAIFAAKEHDDDSLMPVHFQVYSRDI